MPTTTICLPFKSLSFGKTSLRSEGRLRGRQSISRLNAKGKGEEEAAANGSRALLPASRCGSPPPFNAFFWVGGRPATSNSFSVLTQSLFILPQFFFCIFLAFSMNFSPKHWVLVKKYFNEKNRYFFLVFFDGNKYNTRKIKTKLKLEIWPISPNSDFPNPFPTSVTIDNTW